jgi:hypothetical protein
MKYRVVFRGKIVAKNFDTKVQAQNYGRMLRRQRPGYFEGPADRLSYEPYEEKETP